ncbi:MAG: hypothetical protein ACI8WB_000530 [Phenylobacterium sp.]|jgi:hypothetical protein
MKLILTKIGLPLILGAMALAANAEPDIDNHFENSEQDIHFTNKDGHMVPGKRCGLEHITLLRKTKIENKLVTYKKANKIKELNALSGTLATADRNIPVVFHVIYQDSNNGNVSDIQIDKQIDVLNLAYAGSGFTYTLAATTRTQNPSWYSNCRNSSTEREMKEQLAQDPAHNLNIYSCAPTDLLGYASFPDLYPENDVMHGVVLLDESLPDGSAAPYNLGDTATHEVGHYLGLFHTFQGGCIEPGDFVDDTPPEASPAFGCPTNRNSCSGGGSDPIYNFMDYTDDSCMNQFTSGQISRTHDMINIYRPNLGGSNAPLEIPQGVSASFASNTISVTWNAVTEANHYYRQVSVNGGSWKNETRFDSTSATYYNQTSGNSFSYRIKACDVNDDRCSAYSNASPSILLMTSLQNVTASVSGNTISIDWSAIAGANHYYRQVSVNGSNWKNETRFDTTSAVYYNQVSGSSFSYRVKACSPYGCTNYSPGSPAVIVLSSPQNVSASVSQRTISINWSAVSHADYYYREVSVNGGAWKNSTRFDTTSATYYNQTIGNSFSYRVKACTSNGCSDYSAGSTLVTVE